MNSALCTMLVLYVVIWIGSGCAWGRKKRVLVREEILFRLGMREERWRKRRRAVALAGGGVGGEQVSLDGSKASKANDGCSYDSDTCRPASNNQQP